MLPGLVRDSSDYMRVQDRPASGKLEKLHPEQETARKERVGYPLRPLLHRILTNPHTNIVTRDSTPVRTYNTQHTIFSRNNCKYLQIILSHISVQEIKSFVITDVLTECIWRQFWDSNLKSNYASYLELMWWSKCQLAVCWSFLPFLRHNAECLTELLELLLLWIGEHDTRCPYKSCIPRYSWNAHTLLIQWTPISCRTSVLEQILLRSVKIISYFLPHKSKWHLP